MHRITRQRSHEAPHNLPCALRLLHVGGDRPVSVGLHGATLGRAGGLWGGGGSQMNPVRSVGVEGGVLKPFYDVLRGNAVIVLSLR